MRTCEPPQCCRERERETERERERERESSFRTDEEALEDRQLSFPLPWRAVDLLEVGLLFLLRLPGSLNKNLRCLSRNSTQNFSIDSINMCLDINKILDSKNTRHQSVQNLSMCRYFLIQVWFEGNDLRRKKPHAQSSSSWPRGVPVPLFHGVF